MEHCSARWARTRALGSEATRAHPLGQVLPRARLRFRLLLLACWALVPSSGGVADEGTMRDGHMVFIEPQATGGIRIETGTADPLESQREFWVQRLGLRIAKNGDWGAYEFLRGLGQVPEAQDPIMLESMGFEGAWRLATGAPQKTPLDTPTGDLLQSGLSAAAGTVPHGGTALDLLTKLGRVLVEAQTSAMTATDGRGLDTRMDYLLFGPGALRRLWDAMATNPVLKKHVDQLLDERYHIRTTDPVSLDIDPDLAAQAAIRKQLGDREMWRDTTAVVKSLDAVLKKQQADMAAIARQIAAEADARKREQLIATFRSRVQDAHAILFLVQTGASAFDPKMAQQIAVGGAAALKVYESAALHRMGQMSSVAMTANALGAAMTVMSLMQSAQPSAESVLSHQLAAISQQVSDLRVELLHHLSELHHEVGQVYVETINSLELLRSDLTRARIGIVSAQRELRSIHARLGLLDQRVLEYSRALATELTDLQLSSCLGGDAYVANYSPTARETEACAIAFARRADLTGRSALWSPLPPANASIQELSQQLASNGVDQSMNILAASGARWSHDLGVPNLSNPIVLATNSAAYIRVASASAPPILTAGALEQMLERGTQLQHFVRAVASRDGSGLSIFSKILTQYRGMSASIDRVVSRAVDEYSDQLRGYDPWGGPDQIGRMSSQDSWTTSSGGTVERIGTLVGCESSDKAAVDVGQLEAPLRLAKLIPYSYRMADDLGLGVVTVCFANPRWADQGSAVSTAGPNIESVKYTAAVSVDLVGSLQIGNAKGEPAPRVLTIFRRSAKSGIVHTVDCAAKAAAMNGGLNQMIASKDCQDAHAGGLTSAELKGAFATVWSAAGGLKFTFIDGAAEQLASAESKGNLADLQKLISSRLALERKALADDLYAAAAGATNTYLASSSTAVDLRDAVLDLRGLQQVLTSYAAVAFSRSMMEDDALENALAGVDVWNYLARLKDPPKQGLKTSVKGARRVLGAAGLDKAIAQLDDVLERKVKNGAEPFRIVDDLVARLRQEQGLAELRILQRDAACFRPGPLRDVTATRVVVGQDAAEFASLRLIIKSSGKSADRQPARANLAVFRPDRTAASISWSPRDRAFSRDATTTLAFRIRTTGAELWSSAVCVALDDNSRDLKWSIDDATLEAESGGQFLTIAKWTGVGELSSSQPAILLRSVGEAPVVEVGGGRRRPKKPSAP
jgi:hypothetical protein